LEIVQEWLEFGGLDDESGVVEHHDVFFFV
jgi:hypothetical protein